MNECKLASRAAKGSKFRSGGSRSTGRQGNQLIVEGFGKQLGRPEGCLFVTESDCKGTALFELRGTGSTGGFEIRRLDQAADSCINESGSIYNE